MVAAKYTASPSGYFRKINPELPQYVDTQLHMERDQNDGDAFSGSHFATLVN
jgi:hypothetical protein